MGNPYFKFKQFAISQKRCAMKVSTDACLLGAWAPFKAGTSPFLDVGCGTGLLSLMLAQRFPKTLITALELNPDAAAEAAENVAGSLWKAQIEVVAGNVLTHDFEGVQFGGIICNPPFFEKSLGAQTPARHLARHNDSLPLPALLQKVVALLSAGGQLALLLPPAIEQIWEKEAAGSGLVQVQKVAVRPLPAKVPNRILSLWEKSSMAPDLIAEELLLYETYGQYTPAAQALLSPFLLKL